MKALRPDCYGRRIRHGSMVAMRLSSSRSIMRLLSVYREAQHFSPLQGQRLELLLIES